ncbi:MAG TPA: hypothetical protein VIG99_30395 [Myxococcaceae bacterium]|jgi:hypothetical protein
MASDAPCDYDWSVPFEGSTFGAAARQPAHRSLWFARLRRRAGDVPVDDWLIRQANLRGFHGVYLRDPPEVPLDPELSLEEIVVGLVSPAAPLDGRVIKLVARLLQRGAVNVDRLLYLARAERAEAPLYWLSHHVPEPERTGALAALAQHWIRPPRGFRGIRYEYDFDRLIRRPASRDHLWRRAKPS